MYNEAIIHLSFLELLGLFLGVISLFKGLFLVSDMAQHSDNALRISP